MHAVKQRTREKHTETDAPTFDDFVAEYSGHLVDICQWAESTGLLPRSGDYTAEDLYQDVLLRVWKAWDRYEPRRGGYRWLRRITVNAAMNRAVSRNREEHALQHHRYDVEGLLSKVRRVDAYDRYADVRRLLRGVAEDLEPREVAFLHSVLDGDTTTPLLYGNPSPEALKSRRARMRRKLRQVLREAGFHPES